MSYESIVQATEKAEKAMKEATESYSDARKQVEELLASQDQDLFGKVTEIYNVHVVILEKNRIAHVAETNMGDLVFLFSLKEGTERESDEFDFLSEKMKKRFLFLLIDYTASPSHIAIATLE